LFALAKTPQAILALDDETIAQAIKPAGLYNRKTRNIRKFCTALLEEHDGVVPSTREGLLSLPGIGRKCADIVMSLTFGEDVIAVDTHVHRVANRIGLARGKAEAQKAQSLEERSPAWAKRNGHFWLLQFGKRVCTARAPQVPRLRGVRALCLSGENFAARYRASSLCLSQRDAALQNGARRVWSAPNLSHDIWRPVMALTLDLTGHVAVVTGSTSGIGLGIAKSLAQAGAKVALNSPP
jgi:endonuclease III